MEPSMLRGGGVQLGADDITKVYGKIDNPNTPGSSYSGASAAAGGIVRISAVNMAIGGGGVKANAAFAGGSSRRFSGGSNRARSLAFCGFTPTTVGRTGCKTGRSL